MFQTAQDLRPAHFILVKTLLVATFAVLVSLGSMVPARQARPRRPIPVVTASSTAVRTAAARCAPGIPAVTAATTAAPAITHG